MFLDPSKFEVIAGIEVVDTMRNFRAERVRITDLGYADSEDLYEVQRQEEMRGFIGVEVCFSASGASVRYDSGLQNFGLVASSRSLGGSMEAAKKFACDWVAHDPSKRYAWKRK